MAHRSNFLKNLEIFYQTGLVFLPNNTYNDKTKQLFPKQPPFRLPEIKLPPNFLLLYPHPNFTPILFRMTQKYPLKLGGRTVDLYKLIQTVRNFVNQVCRESQNSEKKNENIKTKASETSDILSKTTTWKKVSEILFSESAAGPSCSSPKITVFPPSLLNKLRLIYQKYIQPFEEAHLKAKLEIIRQNQPNIADNGFPENLNLNHPRLTAIDLYLNSDSNSKSRTFDTHRESTSKRKSKYLDYIEGEEEFLELSKDEIDEHGRSILDKKKGNPDLDFLTPDRKKDNDEDDEFKWRPQITASARRNRSSFLNTNDDSNDAGPNTPVSPYPPKIDRSKLKPYRLNSSSKIPNFFQLINSLESGLANERDFAINTLALLSYVNNNAPMTQLYTCNQLKLYKIREANNLIDSLLRHIGIDIEDSTSDFREICTFWAVLLKKKIKQMEDQDETYDMNLKFFQENKFPVSNDTNNEKILSRLKYEEIILRFNTIFDILRNISFDSQNAEILWQNNNFRRFLYICLQTEQYDYKLFSGNNNKNGKDIGGSTLSRTRSSFVVVGLDIFENISRVIVLNKLSIYEKTFWLEVLFMWPERSREITAVDTKLSREFYLRIMVVSF